MESELYSCPICWQEFDLSNRLPRMTLVCGHSICSSCLKELIYNNFEVKCPFDKKSLPKYQNILMFPVNLIARQHIEERIKKEFCEAHGLELSFICLEEKKKICNECVEEHQEQGHKFKSLKKILDKAGQHRKDVKNFMSEIADLEKKCYKILEECRAARISQIKDRFHQIRKIVNRKEQEILFENKAFFDLEKAQIGRLLGENSKLVGSITEVDTELANIVKHEELLIDDKLFTEVEERIREWKKKIDSSEAQKSVWKEFGEMYTMFDDCFKEQEMFGYQLGVPLLDPLGSLIDKLSEDKSKDNKIIRWNPKVGVTYFEFLSHLAFIYSENSLEISNKTAPEKIIINLENLENVEKLNLSLSQPLTKEDAGILGYIWKRIKGPTSLSLNLSSGTINDELYVALTEEVGILTSMEVDIGGYQFTGSCKMMPLINKVLTKASKLKKFSLDMSQASFPGECIARILKIEKTDWPHLEEFELDLCDTVVTDKDINHLLVPLPNVKKFSLLLSDTSVTDKVLEVCAKKVLHLSDSLEDLKLYMYGTRVTDSGIECLLNKLKKINGFDLEMGSTLITDRTLSSFGPHLTSSLNKFEVNLLKTKVSEEGLCGIFKELESVKSFFLGFDQPYITDKAFEIFAQRTLVSMKSLEDLTLWVNSIKITDESVVQLIQNIPEGLKNLLLDFSLTDITDRSMELLIKEKLPKMTKLENLRIEVENTSVTQEMYQIIRSTIDRYNTYLNEKNL